MFLNILQNSQEYTCAEAFLNKVTRLGLKTRLLKQVLSCEFCEFIKNIYFIENLRSTASELQPILNVCLNF